jgi:tetratricopeptide (TPR) repeat protein
MDPYSLVLAGRYEEALAAYDSSSETRDVPFFANRATALLCLGRYGEALASFQKANELANATPMRGTDPFLDTIGSMHWLLGNGEAAIVTLSEVVSRIRSGIKEFSDLSGGAAPGLLLWSAGHCFERPDAAERAVTYLEWVTTRGLINLWPGPIALCVNGKAELSEVTQKQFGQSDLIGLSKPELGTMERRELVQALFYAAFMAKQANNPSLARKYIKACASVKNPLIEEEWYLANCDSVKAYFELQ